MKPNTSKPIILVTGGAGYIGSHTCKALWQAGFIPVCYDNLVYGHASSVKWGPLIEGDIFDTNLLHRVLTQYQPAAILHFAAFAYVGESVTDPGKYYRNNVAGTINLLEAMRCCGCSRIVFSSTCATFGNPGKLPIDENTPQQPLNPYGWSKLMIERILADYDKAYNIRHIILRYFNAAGADPEGEIGELHFPETHLIPLAIFAALRRTGPLTIFGNDYKTPDGTAVRDYIHVRDLADAHLRALEHLLKTSESDAFNLGTGNGTSVKEILNSVAKFSGAKVPVILGQRRPGDPPALVAGASKAKSVLKWKAEFSNIDEIIATAWKFHTACSTTSSASL